MPEYNAHNGRQKNRAATTQPNHDAGGQAALEPLPPAEAVDPFLEHRKGEVSHRTRRKDRYKLKPFVKWCEQEGIENLNNLSGRDLFRYRTWRKEDGDLKDMSLRTRLSSVRVFLRFCVQIDGVPSWLPDQVVMPSVDDEVRQEHLAPERGDRIRSHLQRFDYCSQKHVVYELL